MIYGIGVDQVDLNRVRKLLNKSQTKFEKRCFTQNEIIYANCGNSDPLFCRESRLLQLWRLSW